MLSQLESLNLRIARLERLHREANFHDRSAAGKAYLFDMGLTRDKVRSGEAAMLYKIDPQMNQSKFYEMLIVSRRRGVFTLIKKWGRLGPNSKTIEADFPSLEEARRELAQTLRSKLSRGYISTYSPDHRNTNGAKLPVGQYPVGLESNPGLWRNQKVISCKPALQKLLVQLTKSQKQVMLGKFGRTLISSLQEALALTSELDESMARIVYEKIRAPLNRIKGEGRHAPDPDKIVKELNSLRRYLELQLSTCM
jgi:predicted DNA-binding WGR domain protein